MQLALGLASCPHPDRTFNAHAGEAVGQFLGKSRTVQIAATLTRVSTGGVRMKSCGAKVGGYGKKGAGEHVAACS